ncbi:MAG: tyrosine recombinase XerD [Acidimicrobiaceae bacterium]|nr:tyrosine recombinase XerD [Acidimicrobiaceae bacterium]MXW74742.1 tyrosine recombinase XerD [Acidimicrobiaceae bacterium]MYC42065.1 tyrosine recombinase XerD [Acidimicrobiaceae bacterium]MYD07973.1 tyrosine recombinase XerD [Acidimicrobiaceae bacterium]MYI58435.1 tyrosine recombinase XerD [Acidimicrobiaceae bacterium]
MTTPADAVESVILDECAEDFLTWLVIEKGRASNTLESYRRDLLRYQDHLSRRESDTLSATGDDIVAFVHVLQGSGLAAASVTRTLVAVRGLHRFLVAEEKRLDDPAVDVEIPSVPRGLPKALTVAEVASVIDAVVGNDHVARRDRAILETLYGTGARVSELVSLSFADIDLHDGLIRLLGKGSKERIVPVGRHAASALQQWFEPQGRPTMEPERWTRRSDADAVFLNQRGSRLSRQGAWGVVRRYGTEVGLGAKLSPHVLRHSCATHMLDHGADIRTVQELLGHASISTTQVYTKVSIERLMNVYRAAHPRATGAS